MFGNKAKTVAEYLDGLPEGRRKVIADMLALIRKNIPPGYEESILWGAITYSVPLSVLPDTYNKQPLGYVALAAQKDSYSLYLMNVYGGGAPGAAGFRAAYEASGKKLDMGMSCVRFKSMDDLPLDLIASTIAGTPMDQWIEIYKAARSSMKSNRGKAKAAPEKPAKPAKKATKNVAKKAVKRAPMKKKIAKRAAVKKKPAQKLVRKPVKRSAKKK